MSLDDQNSRRPRPEQAFSADVQAVMLIRSLFPLRTNALKLPYSGVNLRDLPRVKLEQFVTKLQHPLLPRILWVDRDQIGVGDLNLSPAERPDGQATPRQKLN